MLLARSQEDLISMWVWQLSEGDIAYNNGNGNGYEMTSAFEGVLGNYLNQAQLDEFVMIQTGWKNSRTPLLIELSKLRNKQKYCACRRTSLR